MILTVIMFILFSVTLISLSIVIVLTEQWKNSVKVRLIKLKNALENANKGKNEK